MVKSKLGLMGVVLGALCWRRKVVLSDWVVESELGFMGVVVGALCWRKKVVLSVRVVESELGFMGVVIGALYWQRKVVLSVWLVIMIMSEDQFMGDDGDNVRWYDGWSVRL